MDSAVDDDAMAIDESVDAAPLVTATGGTVDLLNFGVFGDVRPNTQDDTANYPTAVFTQVIDGMVSLSPQFIVGTGDYMYVATFHAPIVTAQLDIFQSVEQRYSGHVFHALGNHECTGGTASNCPSGNETPNILAFRARLIADEPALYYDFTVHTSMGDAHFIVTAPNAWSTAQATWLNTALAQTAHYTFVVAHEPPTSPGPPPGSVPIETAISARSPAVTLRMYGHTHDYRQIDTNAVIAGNAGAPLSGTNGTYGFASVMQRADGDIVVTEYSIGRPPMAMGSFVVHADGTQSQ